MATKKDVKKTKKSTPKKLSKKTACDTSNVMFIGTAVLIIMVACFIACASVGIFPL